MEINTHGRIYPKASYLKVWVAIFDIKYKHLNFKPSGDF